MIHVRKLRKCKKLLRDQERITLLLHGNLPLYAVSTRNNRVLTGRLRPMTTNPLVIKQQATDIRSDAARIAGQLAMITEPVEIDRTLQKLAQMVEQLADGQAGLVEIIGSIQRQGGGKRP